MEHAMSKKLMTRNDCRKLGLAYSNTQFQRWERDRLLTAIKPGRRRSSRVYYDAEEVESFLNTKLS